VLRLMPGVYREPIADALRQTVLRPVLAMQRNAVESRGAFADPVRLRAERDSLAAYLVGSATLASENAELRELLGLSRRLPPSFVPADVVRIRERGFEGAFLVTAGSAEGVQVGAPIVAVGGLVGTILQVHEQQSLAMDWTNSDFRASAMTVDGETFGIVEPRRGPGGEDMLALTGAAFHTELPEGTLIVTSGRGGVYPRGIPIGRVVRAEDSQAGWRKSYLVRPLVSPAEMVHVLILGQPQGSDQSADLASAWGIRPTNAPADTTAPLPPAGVTTGAPPTATPAEQRPGAQPQRRGPRLLGVPVQPPPEGDR
jgi:rod shape-determining protein MreC